MPDCAKLVNWLIQFCTHTETESQYTQRQSHSTHRGRVTVHTEADSQYTCTHRYTSPYLHFRVIRGYSKSNQSKWDRKTL